MPCAIRRYVIVTPLKLAHAIEQKDVVCHVYITAMFETLMSPPQTRLALSALVYACSVGAFACYASHWSATRVPRFTYATPFIRATFMNANRGDIRRDGATRARMRRESYGVTRERMLPRHEKMFITGQERDTETRGCSVEERGCFRGSATTPLLLLRRHATMLIPAEAPLLVDFAAASPRLLVFLIFPARPPLRLRLLFCDDFLMSPSAVFRHAHFPICFFFFFSRHAFSFLLLCPCRERFACLR